MSALRALGPASRPRGCSSGPSSGSAFASGSLRSTVTPTAMSSTASKRGPMRAAIFLMSFSRFVSDFSAVNVAAL